MPKSRASTRIRTLEIFNYNRDTLFSKDKSTSLIRKVLKIESMFFVLNKIVSCFSENKLTPFDSLDISILCPEYLRTSARNLYSNNRNNACSIFLIEEVGLRYSPPEAGTNWPLMGSSRTFSLVTMKIRDFRDYFLTVSTRKRQFNLRIESIFFLIEMSKYKQ